MKFVSFKSVLDARLDNKHQNMFIHKFGASAYVPLSVWCKIYTSIDIPLYYIMSQDCLPETMKNQLRDLSVDSAERVLPIVEHYYPEFTVFRELIANYKSGKKDRDLIIKAAKIRYEIKKLEEAKSSIECHRLAAYYAADAIVTAVATAGEILHSYFQEAHRSALRAVAQFSNDATNFLGIYHNLQFEETRQLVSLCILVEKWTAEGFETYEKEVVKVHNYRELECFERLIRSWTIISHTAEEADYHDLIKQIQWLKNPNELTKIINPLVINSTVNYKKLLESVVPYYENKQLAHSKERHL